MHATIMDVVADTAQNSIEAGAKHIRVDFIEENNVISVAIVDDGKGMSEEVKNRVFDPFFTEPGKHDARRVGLGLPILKQLCEECEGGLTLKSEQGRGTTLKYHFNARHIDLPPMGDIPATVVSLFNYPGDFEFVFTHRKDGREYSIARSELAEAVGGLESVEGISLAREFIAGQEEFEE